MTLAERVVDLLARAEAAALGGSPDDADPPLDALAGVPDLDPVGQARGTWLRAVAAGARGRYGRALDLLEPLVDGARDEPEELVLVQAAACATAASLLRQIGDHPAGDPLDRHGLTLLAALPSALGPDVRLDCAVGATADAVGLGDLVLARERLAAARRLLTATSTWRPLVRLHWVEVEVGLLDGDAAAAVGPARSAVALATEAGSPRHLAKSAMFLGVAQALTGEPEAAAGSLRGAARLAERHRLLPLVWPVRAVLATMPGLAADASEADEHLEFARAAVRAIADELPPQRRMRWTERDPMAAFLLADNSRAAVHGRQGS